MKVLIINPPWPGKGFGTRSQNRIIKKRADKFIQFPLLLAYASSNLRKHGHDVVFLDSIMDEIGMDETMRRIGHVRPDVVIMETTTPSVTHDFRFLDDVKKRFNPFIIAVGQHVTGLPMESMKDCAGIDVIIKGEFDPWVPEVLENIKDLSKVTGIVYRKGKKVVDNGPGRFCHDLDSLPFPDRETIPFDRYGEAWFNKRPFTNMQTTRGCPYGCTYCVSPHIMEGLRWRTRSVENTIEEIKELVNKYGVKEINIDDPTFNIDKKRVIEFCRALRKEKLKFIWTVNMRANNVDDEMLREMRVSGCKMLRFGVEASDDEVLRKMNKNLSLDTVKKAVRLTQKHKILALCGFMFGFPYDTKNSVEANIKFAKELNPDLIQTSIVLPYPGTVLYKEIVRDGKLKVKSWDDFDMTHGIVVDIDGIDKEYLDGILKRMYTEFYFRPRFFIRTFMNIRRVSDISRIMRNFKTLVKTANFYGKKEEC